MEVMMCIYESPVVAGDKGTGEITALGIEVNIFRIVVSQYKNWKLHFKNKSVINEKPRPKAEFSGKLSRRGSQPDSERMLNSWSSQ